MFVLILCVVCFAGFAGFLVLLLALVLGLGLALALALSLVVSMLLVPGPGISPGAVREGDLRTPPRISLPDPVGSFGVMRLVCPDDLLWPIRPLDV